MLFFCEQGLELGDGGGLYGVPLLPEDLDQLFGVLFVCQDIPDGIGNDLFQLVGGYPHGVAAVLTLFLGALVIVVPATGGTDGHG